MYHLSNENETGLEFRDKLSPEVSSLRFEFDLLRMAHTANVARSQWLSKVREGEE